MLSSLQHPNLVGVHAVLAHGDGIALLLEYVPGPSLASVLHQGQVRPQEALLLLDQVGAALDAVHAQGVVHRDVKPSNVLVSPGAAKLSDFGLATLAPGVGMPFTVLTNRGVPLGTAPYMSPEAVTGESAMDCRADVYSFGAVAYELLTGAPPFPGTEGMLAVLSAHLHADPPLPTSRAPWLPAGIDPVLTQALAKHPAERPASAGRVATALRAVFDRAGGLPEPPDLSVLAARVPSRLSPLTTVVGGPAAVPVPLSQVALPQVPPVLPHLARRRTAGPTAWWVLSGLLGGAALVAVLLAIVR